MDLIFRKAEIADIDSLETLIKKSATAINSAYYSKKEIDAALGNAWTVDRQLIIDNTYWIVENFEGFIVGCGGWSKRKLLFGKSDILNSLDNELIPGIDSARIRAFFVDPDFVRLGIGKRLLEKCELESKSFGFDSLELVATLSGEKLYSSSGFIPLKFYDVDLGNGITNKVISMYKSLK
jgi:N-acetylglutamate synthase-like GNAT family acetyltransferase